MELLTINTERLILREVRMSDAEDVYRIWSNPSNDLYMRDGVDNLEQVKFIIDIQIRKDNSFLYIALLDEEIIGTCVFGETELKGQLNLGYSIAEEHWGSGYGTEMVETIIELGIYNGYGSFIADCAVENLASARVLEKVGMDFVGFGEFTQARTGKVFKSKNYELNVF